MSDVISAIGVGKKIADVTEKSSGVLARIVDYWGLGRYLDRRSRAKDVDAAVAQYESLYGTDMPDDLKDLLYTKYLAETRRLDNLAEVLSIVREARRGKNDAGTIPQQDWLDAFEDGASHAYEDEIRTLWAQLLDAEITSAGSFSKRTIATLKGMNGMEARKLRILCSWSVEIQDQTGRWVPIPLLQSPLECGAGANGIPLSEISMLEDAGLTTQMPGHAPDVYVQPDSTCSIRINTMPASLHNKSDHLLVYRPTYAFTSIGIQLSKLCILGDADADLLSILQERLALLEQ
ncbi:DUF2806 domain-containing protein [uncultured Bifidobacterium sp.]|uniref:DUF2806 domain-containing protein n=1 Tax=uncultured Bifidobacterium sp. TaxID=165187 RepID=UPI002587DF92|nr:DUF2806 domain-containing protein [uncultured Bifidobacterium sp.]